MGCMFGQLLILKTKDDADKVYQHYVPTIVRCLTTFAKAIPQFLDLNTEDQHLVIKVRNVHLFLVLSCFVFPPAPIAW